MDIGNIIFTAQLEPVDEYPSVEEPNSTPVVEEEMQEELEYVNAK